MFYYKALKQSPGMGLNFVLLCLGRSQLPQGEPENETPSTQDGKIFPAIPINFDKTLAISKSHMDGRKFQFLGSSLSSEHMKSET